MSRRLITTIVLPIALIIGLSACSGRPENSPEIRKKFTEMKAMNDQIIENEKQLRAIAADLAAIKTQMSNVLALAPDAEGNVDVLDRIAEIESNLRNYESASVKRVQSSGISEGATPAREIAMASDNKPLAGGGSTLASPNANKKSPPEVVTESTVAQKMAAEVTKKTEPVKETKTVQTTAKAPVKTEAPKKEQKRGKWYELKAGDTLEKIAADNGISVDALRKANKLPPGARILKGQSIYIPAS